MTDTQQFNGREDETATLFVSFSIKFYVDAGGFAPRHLSRSMASCYNQNRVFAMRYLAFTFLLFVALTSGCATATSSSQQTSVSETVPTATPKLAFDQAAIEKLNESLPEDVRQILEQAENFEIISPKGIGFGKQKVAGEIIAVSEQWRFAVAGKTQVTDSAVRTELLDALYSSIIEAKPNSRMACFYPRHAIRATKQGKTVELVICFDCHVALGNSPNGKIGALITKSQREIFNRIYTSAGLEIQP